MNRTVRFDIGLVPLATDGAFEVTNLKRRLSNGGRVLALANSIAENGHKAATVLTTIDTFAPSNRRGTLPLFLSRVPSRPRYRTDRLVSTRQPQNYERRPNDTVRLSPTEYQFSTENRTPDSITRWLHFLQNGIRLYSDDFLFVEGKADTLIRFLDFEKSKTSLFSSLILLLRATKRTNT